MFDTYEYRAGDQHHHHHRSEVHEHRAPTDASVKLLKEMEQAALEKILGTIRLEGGPVDCVIVHRADWQNDEHQFLIRYKLGTVTREARHTYRPQHGASSYEAREQCLEQLRGALAADIALQLLARPFALVLSRGELNLGRP